MIINVLFMLFVFIFTYWCPTRFPHQLTIVSFNSYTTGATIGAGTVNPSGRSELTLLISGVRIAQCLALSSMLYLPGLFLLAMVLDVLQFAVSDYFFDIFKLFL